MIATIPAATKILFIIIGMGLVAPALHNVFRASNMHDRRYDRSRNRRQRPVSQARYNRLWVIDREDHE